MAITSEHQLAEYITKYLSTLLTEIKKLDPNQQRFFEFQKEGPYHCVGFISETQGAAVAFHPSDRHTIEIKRVLNKERIEAIFPKNPDNEDTLIQTQVGPNKQFSNIRRILVTLELRKAHILQDKNELVVFDKGVNLIVDKDSVYKIQDRLILKGDNSAKKWTKEVAVKDAFDVIISTLLNWKDRLPSKPIKTLKTRIAKFEALINLSEIKEDHLQSFFEKHNEFLQMGCMYKKIYPHITLPREEEDLIPDFFLERVTEGYNDILEIKLPDKSLIVGGHNRRKFSAHVESAIAQVHEYGEYFNDQANRKRLQEKHGVDSRIKITIFS